MRNTRVSLVRSKLLLRSGNLTRLTLWWVTADWWLRAESTPSSKSLIYKKEKKTNSSLIMWHRYTKRTIRWLCPSSSRCKEVQDQPQRDRGRTSRTVYTCEEMERGTHACKASDLGSVEWWWTQDGKLGITIQDPPPESEDKHIYCILLICFAFCHVSENSLILVSWYYGHLFLFSMLIQYVTLSQFWLYLLNIYHFTYTFSHTHTERHTHMYNQHTRGMETTRYRSLVERGGRKSLLETLYTHTHTHTQNVRNKTNFHESKRKDSIT